MTGSGKPSAGGPREASPPAAPVAGDVGNRKLIRPSLTRTGLPAAGERRQRPRVTPPDSTGLEAAYYGKQVNVGSRLVVTLDTGEVLKGVLEWHDRGSLRLRRDGAPAVVILKHAIAFLGRDDSPSS